MKIRDLAEEEFDNLKPFAKRFQGEVERVLSKIRGRKVRLFLQEGDMYRLLKLRSWSEMYSVDLKYILQKLLPFWEQFLRKKTKRIKSEGLGIRVGTLTGKKSEEMLVNFIHEDFPSGQNELFKRASRQEKIIGKVFDRKNKDAVKTEGDISRGLFDFPDPKGYLQYYKRKMRKEQEIREEVVDEMSKRPFRGNPFIN